MIKTASILGFWNNSLLKNAMRPRPPWEGHPLWEKKVYPRYFVYTLRQLRGRVTRE